MQQEKRHMMSTQWFRRTPVMVAAFSFVLLAGGTIGYALAATAPAPAPAAGAASPFGRLAPVAPVGPTAGATQAAAAPAAQRPAVSTAPAAAENGAAVPRVIVIDRNFIMQRSAAGKDMLAQTQSLSKAAEAQFKKEEEALTTEASQLQQQMAILAVDVRAQKEKDFVAKQQAFQARVQSRQAEIQAGFNKAARQLEMALEPILQAIMRERGANMVLDRQSVIIATADIDITPTAVQRLDKVLPKVKVELTSVAANSAPAAAKR
jgi:Skp family chaperone for outer membrane proteins